MYLHTSTPKPSSGQMLDLSTSIVSDYPSSLASLNSPTISPKEKIKAKKNPKMLDLICEAIKEIALPRKGASYNAIKKWVIECGQKEKSGQQFLTQFKRAFLKGMETKVLIRMGSSQDTGLRGYFVLKKEPKVKAKTAPPPKQAAKPRPPPKRVTNTVLIARKKKNMAIMNSSLILKRKSLLLNMEKKTDSVKAKAKDAKSANEKEPGPSKKPSTAKTSKKNPKLSAGKLAKVAPRGKKQTKAIANDGNEKRQLQKTVITSKKQPKSTNPTENQSNATTKRKTVTKPQIKKQAKVDTVEETEGPKRKNKIISSDDAEAPRRKLVKTTSSDETGAASNKIQQKTKPTSKKNLKRKTPGDTELSKETYTSSDAVPSTSKQMKTASSDESENPLKKQTKTKDSSKQKLEKKTRSETELPKEVNAPSVDEVEASASEQTETTASTGKIENPLKKQTKTKADSKQKLGKKTHHETEVSKEINTPSVDEVESSASDQATDETEAPSKKQPKTKAPSKKNIKAGKLENTEVITKEINTITDAIPSTSKQMKTTSSDETEAPLKKQAKTKAQPKQKMKTKPDGETDVSSKEVAKPSLNEAEASTSTQLKTASSAYKTEAPAKKQPKSKAPIKKNLKAKALDSTEDLAKEMTTTSDEDEAPTSNQMKTVSNETESSDKKRPKKKAEGPNKKVGKIETEKQPEVNVDGTTSKTSNVKEKKPKKKDLQKFVLKVKGRKTYVRKDVSDSELDISKRTEPLKSYHSDPELSMIDN